MATVTFNLDDNTHFKFKIYCARKDISMKTALRVAVDLILRGKIKGDDEHGK